MPETEAKVYWGWSILCCGLICVAGATTLIQKFFYPSDYAAVSLNRAILQCSGTARANSSDIDFVLYRLVECDVISTAEADRWKQLHNEKKVYWNSKRREWVTPKMVAKDQQKENWLREHPAGSSSPRP